MVGSITFFVMRPAFFDEELYIPPKGKRKIGIKIQSHYTLNDEQKGEIDELIAMQLGKMRMFERGKKDIS